MPMGTNMAVGMVASEATLTGISIVRSINSAMVLMLCLPGTRSVTEAMWLGNISLRSKGMECEVKRGVWLLTTEGVGPG